MSSYIRHLENKLTQYAITMGAIKGALDLGECGFSDKEVVKMIVGAIDRMEAVKEAQFVANGGF